MSKGMEDVVQQGQATDSILYSTMPLMVVRCGYVNNSHVYCESVSLQGTVWGPLHMAFTAYFRFEIMLQVTKLQRHCIRIHIKHTFSVWVCVLFCFWGKCGYLGRTFDSLLLQQGGSSERLWAFLMGEWCWTTSNAHNNPPQLGIEYIDPGLLATTKLTTFPVGCRDPIQIHKREIVFNNVLIHVCMLCLCVSNKKENYLTSWCQKTEMC